MAEPQAVDVRDGLTAPVVEGLRRAARVDVQAAGDTVLALGYWSHDTSAHGAVSARLQVALIDGELQDITLVGRTLSFAGAAALMRWKNFARTLRPGDVVRGVWSPTRVSFTVQRGGEHVLEFRQNPAASTIG